MALYSQPILMLMASFTAIAWYNVIELNVMIWTKFKRYKGLYFYSLLISSWGIVLHALGFLIEFFQLWNEPYAYVTIIIIGVRIISSLSSYHRTHSSFILWTLFPPAAIFAPFSSRTFYFRIILTPRSSSGMRWSQDNLWSYTLDFIS
jgi:hypothetical protein